MDPDYFKGKVFFKAFILTAVILVSYLIGNALSATLNLTDSRLSGAWCAISAIVVFDDLLDNVKKLIKDRLLGTFMGALLTTFIMSWSGNQLLSISISIFLVCLASILFKWNGALKIGCITVLIIGITTGGKSIAVVWETGLMRFLESATGGLVSILATMLIYRTKNMGISD